MKQFSNNIKLNKEDLNQNWKGPILDQEIINNQIKNKKVLPILVSENDAKFIPQIFQESKQFFLESDYEELHSFLTEQKHFENLINQKPTHKTKNKNSPSAGSVRVIKNEGALHLLKQQAKFTIW